jgi:hypothetical protein
MRDSHWGTPLVGRHLGHPVWGTHIGEKTWEPELGDPHWGKPQGEQNVVHHKEGTELGGPSLGTILGTPPPWETQCGDPLQRPTCIPPWGTFETKLGGNLLWNPRWVTQGGVPPLADNHWRTNLRDHNTGPLWGSPAAGTP